MTYWSGIIYSRASVNKKNAKGWSTRVSMTIGIEGTFDYVTIVPDSLGHSTSPWAVHLRESLENPDHPDSGLRLVGPSPNLLITDAGPTPNPSRSRPPVP